MFYTSIYYSQVYLVISGLLSCCTPALIIQATICIRRGKNYIKAVNIDTCKRSSSKFHSYTSRQPWQLL